MKQRRLKVRKGHRDYTLKSKPCSDNPILPFFFSKVPGWNRQGSPLIRPCPSPSRTGGFRLFGSTFSERLAPALRRGFSRPRGMQR